MAFTLTEASPAEIAEDGGALILISGTCEVNHRYEVHLGDTGSYLDPKMYSGVPGSGWVVTPFTLTQLRAYTPRVPPAIALSVTVIDVDTLETHVLASVITARPKQYFNGVFNLRKMLPPNYLVGARNLE
jgi:hypothetical protein